jgi:regulatory protein
MDLFERARELALNYLDYAPRTRQEVARRLAKAEYEEEIIEAVLADLERIGVVNDAQFSQDWVESRSGRKKIGRVRLAAELRQKGVDKEAVAEAIADVEPETEVEAAVELAGKRLREADFIDPGARQAAKRRLSGYLQRRGYNWEIIEQVFVRLFANEE